MGKLIDKFGAYATNLSNVLAGTTKQCVIASHFRVNSINLVKQMFSFAVLSLATQKENTDITTIVNLAPITHEKYIKLEKI